MVYYKIILGIVVLLCVIGILYMLIQIVRVISGEDDKERELFKQLELGKKSMNYNMLEFNTSENIPTEIHRANVLSYGDTLLIPSIKNKLSAKLVNISDRTQCYILDEESTTIGRGKECDVKIDYDSTVSRRHAQILFSEGDYKIKDYKSMNGTWVNQEKVEYVKVLRNGDRIKVGRVEFIFESE